MQAKRFALLSVVASLGCEDETTDPPSLIDPFGDTVTFPLTSPGRSLDHLSSEGVEVIVTMELADALATFRFDGATWTEGARLDGLQGPRAACAFGGWVTVAEAGSQSLVSFVRTPDGFVEQSRRAVGEPPTQIACGDVDGDGAGDAVAIVGLGDAATLRVFSGAALQPMGDPVSAPQASRVRLGDADGDGDADAVVARTTAGEVMLLESVAGNLALRRTIPVVEPRSASVAEDVVAIAEDGAIVILRTPWGSSEPLRIAAPDDLYDVWLDHFDEDGVVDVAAVSLATHEIVTVLAIGTDREMSFTRPVPRGPIALTAADVDGSGRKDLIILSYEQPAVAILPGTRSD